MENRIELSIEYEQEADGRWIAEVMEIPGIMVYGATRDEAKAKAQALALRCSPTASNTARNFRGSCGFPLRQNA